MKCMLLRNIYPWPMYDVLLLFSHWCSQVDVSGSRKAVVIHIPYRLRKAFRKIHVRLVRELEKKFSGKVINLNFDLLAIYF